MDLFEIAECIVVFAAQIRDSADIPQGELDRATSEMTKQAEGLGFAPDRVSAVADEVRRSVTEFADALRAAGRAAERVFSQASEYAEELEKSNERSV